jgi:quinolinate synthase
MLRLQAPLPERYIDASPDELAERIGAAKAALGSRLLILGHHYQRPEVIRWADARGDSFQLARLAADHDDAEFIVFCGVHFMAESADILTGDHQQVILPDLNAGCSMADMADLDQVEEAWESLEGVVDLERLVPITYMNSSAALKAFVGRNGGAVCTSSNARAVLEWAFARGDTGGEPSGEPTQEASAVSGRAQRDPTKAGQHDAIRNPHGYKVLFFPDQHLGRNTAITMGYTHDDLRVWNPRFELGGLTEADCKDASVLLWKGHCSVHQRFTPQHVEAFRAEHPDGIVIVHPECAHEVCVLADQVGSTTYIVKAVEAAPVGSTIAVGTEIHLVQRLAEETPDKTVVSLDPIICPCSTMSRIDAPHLAWVLDRLVDGVVVNRITVDEDTAHWARVALERMLEIT